MIYLLIINILAFLLMALDKLLAKMRRRRIPESMLLGIAFIGGSLGACIAMWSFRHKTRHQKFAVGLPLIFLLHLIVIFLLSAFII